MENNNFNVLAKGKNKILEQLPLFIYYVNEGKITETDLFQIKESIYQVKKNELLDDFLLEFFVIKKYTFDNIINLLFTLDHPLSRRVIINLINCNVINDTNVDSISINYPQVKKYYDIIFNNYKFDYKLANLEKYYRNIQCVNTNFFQYHSNQIGSLPILDEDKELYLFLERDKGNQEATDYLIISNLRLARSLATTYAYKFESNDVDELYQNGVMGLINAVNKYNVYTGIKFSTYATYSISRAIRRGYLSDNVIYLPTDIVEGTNTRSDEETLKAIDNVNKGVLSLDVNISDDDDDATFGDILTASTELSDNCEFYKDVEEVAILHQMMEETDNLIDSCLTDEEKNMLKSYIIDEKTQKEIVALLSLNMTHQNVSLRIKKIIKKLRDNLEFQKLLCYVSDGYKEDAKMKKEEKKEIKEEKKEVNKVNDPYNYRQITKDRLRKDFYEYSFITDEVIENELRLIDEKIILKENLIATNNELQEELLKKSINFIKVIKMLKQEATYLQKGISTNNHQEFRFVLDFIVSTYDKYSDVKKNKYLNHLDTVYTISEIDSHLDPNPLLNYMTADIKMYKLLANQIRLEGENSETLLLAQLNTNTQLYAMVRTACIRYFNDSSDDFVQKMIEKVITTYNGDNLLLEHVATTVKLEYEIANGKYVPPVVNTSNFEPEEILLNGNYTQHEYYGHYMKIWELVETDDKDYYNFLVLKYKDLKNFDTLCAKFDNAYQYYIDSILYINDNIKAKEKEDVKKI